MIFMVKYQTKKDATDPHSNFTRTFYIEHPSELTREVIRKLVDHVSGGDFDESSIEIEERLEFTAKEIKSQGIRVYKFD